LAEAVLRSGDRGELETEYRALTTAPRATPHGLYAAGQMAARLGRPEDQEAAWKRLRQEFPDDLLAQRAAFELAKSAYAAGRWDRRGSGRGTWREGWRRFGGRRSSCRRRGGRRRRGTGRRRRCFG